MPGTSKAAWQSEDVRLPTLQRTEGSLVIHARGARLPALTHVVRCLIVYSSYVQLPALESAGWWLKLHTLDVPLPRLTNIGSNMIPINVPKPVYFVNKLSDFVNNNSRQKDM